ncbi:ubiquinol-cytochrome c reductase complex 17 kd protein [Penicillium brasilianum]|uniref:Cytochrome b-c1 complex subunit 6, mitochondrial n=1 Tax=Penicillium brasilianum TaxID=104259 RepID=A0A1S9RYI3_PENBI|nr:ubiquinol-cytochrome c reductase complex 17 kd protein [Penicillium brasilianum]
MGFADFFTDVVSSLGFTEAQAEAPAADVETSTPQDAEPAEKTEESTEESTETESAEETPEESSEESSEEAPEEEEAAEDEEEEEEEEEEPEDIKPKLEEVGRFAWSQRVTGRADVSSLAAAGIGSITHTADCFNGITIASECANSAQCAPYKHHFEECVERVTRQQEDEDYKGPKEDCVEEFFHLTHCATSCAAPKLWRELK